MATRTTTTNYPFTSARIIIAAVSFAVGVLLGAGAAFEITLGPVPDTGAAGASVAVAAAPRTSNDRSIMQVDSFTIGHGPTAF